MNVRLSDLPIGIKFRERNTLIELEIIDYSPIPGKEVCDVIAMLQESVTCTVESSNGRFTTHLIAGDTLRFPGDFEIERGLVQPVLTETQMQSLELFTQLFPEAIQRTLISSDENISALSIH